jgi:uncharacterized phage protein (TIGR01671 family)
MREILFRGKWTYNEEWVYGGFTLSATGAPIITVKDGSGLLFPEVKPETVGQYTGIGDKNGVKIFEEDIVKSPCQRGFIQTGAPSQRSEPPACFTTT